MSKNKNNESGYIYFYDAEETVIRNDETQKTAIAKFAKRKKALKVFMSIISIVLIIGIVVIFVIAMGAPLLIKGLMSWVGI